MPFSIAGHRVSCPPSLPSSRHPLKAPTHFCFACSVWLCCPPRLQEDQGCPRPKGLFQGWWLSEEYGTVRAGFYLIYFTQEAKESIKLFRQFDYLPCQCGRRGGLAVSRPLISRSWWGAHVPHHKPPPAQIPPPVHSGGMTTLCCPWMKPMTTRAKGTQTPSLTPPLHDFCYSIAGNCGCQRGSRLIRGLHP